MRPPKNQTKTYNGFAIPLQPDTQLGIALLIAEDEKGQYGPVAVASTINEAEELAESNFRYRVRRLDLGTNRVSAPRFTSSRRKGSMAVTASRLRSV